MYGGGALVGVGAKHGAFIGAELNGGTIANVAVGYDSRARMYARVDALLDSMMAHTSTNPEPPKEAAAGGRIGIGVAKRDDDAMMMFVAGPYGGAALADATCDHQVWVGQLGLELRYLGEWQIVGAARVENETASCFGGK